MRYSLQALADAAGMTLAELGRHLNISGSTFKGYRDEGMTEVVADRRAAQCGFVAWEVWPEMLEEAIADDQSLLAVQEEERRERRRAQKREQARRRYWRDPERERERNRRYRAEVGDYERLRMRRYYEAHAEEQRAKARERYWAGKRGDMDVKDVA